MQLSPARKMKKRVRKKNVARAKRFAHIQRKKDQGHHLARRVSYWEATATLQIGLILVNPREVAKVIAQL